MIAIAATLATLREELAADAAKPDAPAIIARTAPLPVIDPLDWLAAQPPGERLYWQGRNGEVVAGVGAAHLIAGTAHACAKQFLELYQRAPQAPASVRYYGGLAFDRDAVDELWAPFRRCRFQLPATVLTRHPDGRHSLTLNRVTLPAARAPAPAAAPAGPDTTAADWQRGVARVLDAIAAGTLEKAVLAARSTLPTTADFDPFDLLRELREHADDAFVFAFEPTPGTVFLGASPERLYRREGTTISTEALAGTRPRDTDPAADRKLADELLHSTKDRAEQQVVLRELLARLRPLCSNLTVAEEAPTLLRLETVQHLVQHLSGTIAPGVLDHHVIQAIHPTPAVGGRPREAAGELIRECETCARGWYAAPVGWLSPRAAEFAVAIRSALYANHHLHLYAGAGIVKASNADLEWLEVQQKQALLRRLATQP